MRLPTCLVVAVVAAGCASPMKDDRPLPVDDPDADGIVYLVKAPAEDLQKAAGEVLRVRYGQSSLGTGTTGYGTPFWHLSTDYREYKVDAKRLRSRCAVHCFSFQEFPQYVCLSVSTDVEKHDLRSTFHGFPSWGWHREQGAYLAHEIIEEIVRVAAVPESRQIRLRTDPRQEERVKLIEARESGGPDRAAEPGERKG